MTSDASPPSAPRERRRFALWLAAIFVVALGVRLAFVGQYDARHPQAERPLIDEASYDRWAREIAGGEVLGREIFFQEPLYAYALGAVYALVGPGEARLVWARRVQALLGALTAVGVALLAARLANPGAGVIAGWAMALYRPAIWMGALLLKPNLFLPLLVLFALTLDATRTASTPRAQRARWFAFGLLAGAGALLRGNMLILAPAFVLWPLARALAERQPWRGARVPCICVLAGLASVLAPVAWRNQVVGGRFVLSTSGAGTNVYGGNNRDNPFGLATEFDWVRGVPEHEASDWQHEAERRVGRALDPTEVSGYWLRQAAVSVLADPLLHASILWHKLRLSLGRYEVPDNHFLEWDARYVPLLRAPLPGFGVWGTLGLAGLAWILWRGGDGARRGGRWVDMAALFALYLGTIVLTVTSERVRLALVPLLLPAAAVFVQACWRPRGRLPGLVLTLAGAAALVWTPALPAEKVSGDFDERDFNLAVGWLDDPARAAETRALADGLEARHPRAPRVAILQAELDFRASRVLDDGARAIERAQDLQRSALARLALAATSSKARERFQAHLLAGAILQVRGQWSAAREAFEAAREFDPDDRDLRRRWIVVRAEEAVRLADPAARRGGLEQALESLRALRAEADEPELAGLEAKLRAAL